MNKGIELYSTFREFESCIIERFNRTLKNKMLYTFTQHGIPGTIKNWVNILPTLIDQYNTTVHRTTRMSPIDASKPENEKDVKAKINKKITKWVTRPPKFAVGMNVRIYQWENTFTKGYKPNYTTEVFKIKEVYDTVPYTYTMEDKNGEVVLGKMYEEEMIQSQF